MKKTLQKLTSILLTACLVMAVPMSASAVTEPGRLSGTSKSFWNSPYFTKVVNTYNNSKALKYSDADRFVQVALSQKGYMASATNGDYNGDGTGVIASGKKHYTEYSRSMGVNGKNWCASYVSWVAKAAGISNSVIAVGGACGHWRSPSANGGKFMKLWSNDFKSYIDYKPQVGDLVLYTGTCSHDGYGCGRYANAYNKTAHVGIVISVASKKNANGSWTFNTVERTTIKSADTVGIKTHTTKDTRGKGVATCTCTKKCTCGKGAGAGQVKLVQGFFHPKWADNRTATAAATKDLTGKISNPAPNPAPQPDTYKAGSFDRSRTNAITTAKGSMVWPTNATYTAKLKITGTNAVVVTNIKKASGTSFTKVGIVLYDANWNSLKEKTFSVTNVSKATTSFHSWFDINKELGVTLKPSSKYYYRIWGYVDGVKIATPHWGFTTASK